MDLHVPGSDGTDSNGAPGPTAHSPLGDGRPLDQILSAQRLESIGRLATGIAHDFNNVLGVILGYVELARMSGPTNAKHSRHLDQALGTIGRARMLSDRLMEFARGGVKKDWTSDLNLVVEEVRELLAETIDPRIELKVQTANDAPWLPIEQELLAQVVMNLAQNACDALEDEAGCVAIETRRAVVGGGDPHGLPPGIYATLRVVDTGPGVAPELRAHIFEPYRSGREGGSGLGLWAVRRIVERAGGDVRLDDAEGGASFTVRLPGEPTSEESGDRQWGARSAGGERVLVVDDEPGVREVTRSHLEGAGYEVHEADSVAAARAALANPAQVIDLVLLDLQLADGSGTDLALELSTGARPVGLVLMTGSTGHSPLDEHAVTAPRLRKPYLSDELLNVVRGVLARAD